VIAMTISIASPDPISSAPARFFGLLQSTVAGVGSQVARVLRDVKERAEIVVRGLRGAASDVDVVPAVRAQPWAVVDGPETRTGLATPGTAASLRTARILSVVVAVAMVLASAVGLWWRGLYEDPAPAAAMFRGYDLVSLAVATPLLAAALARARAGSPRAQLLWAGMLAYAVYTYSYYVFGAALNALLLVHVALLVLSAVALVLVLRNLDIAGIADGFDERTPVRSVAAVLGFLAAGLGGMWVYNSLRSAVTGAALPQGVLVQPAPILRLGYVLDLATLVPGYAGSASLLWRRRPWGYVLAAVLLTASGVIQLDYMTALLFQAAAKVPGATPYDPQEPFIAAAIGAAAAVLLANLRPVRQDDAATALRVLS
jgi:hypothetical protein